MMCFSFLLKSKDFVQYLPCRMDSIHDTVINPFNTIFTYFYWTCVVGLSLVDHTSRMNQFLIPPYSIHGAEISQVGVLLFSGRS